MMVAFIIPLIYKKDETANFRFFKTKQVLDVAGNLIKNFVNLGYT